MEQNHSAARAGQSERDRVNGYRVEPISHLANDLAQPELTKAAIATQQLSVTDRSRSFEARLNRFAHLLRAPSEDGERCTLETALVNFQVSGLKRDDRSWRVDRVAQTLHPLTESSL